MIATADIGELAAELLTSAWTARRIVELGSPVSPQELAASMGEVLGRPVEAQTFPRETWTATLEQFGIPMGKTWAMEEMGDGINSGWIHHGVPGTEARPGTTSASEVYRQYLKG